MTLPGRPWGHCISQYADCEREYGVRSHGMYTDKVICARGEGPICIMEYIGVQARREKESTALVPGIEKPRLTTENYGQPFVAHTYYNKSARTGETGLAALSSAYDSALPPLLTVESALYPMVLSGGFRLLD